LESGIGTAMKAGVIFLGVLAPVVLAAFCRFFGVAGAWAVGAAAALS
jgi:hypothetical protein